MDDYVIKVLNDQIKNTQNFKEYYAELKKDYPLLCYEFEITPDGAKKRTPKELVECAYYSVEKNDRKVYEYLIRSSATQRKCEDVNNNILEYTKIALDPNTPQEVVDLITENVIAPSNGKYIEIFNTRNV